MTVIDDNMVSDPWRAAGHRPRGRARLGAALAVLLTTAAAAANAHDTWFAVRGATLPGNAVLALGTGNQFPVHESTIAAEHLQVQGCRQGPRELPLAAVANTRNALLLRAQAATPQALSCWAQLVPFEIEIEADKVALYLDEINASQALRQTWATMLARGVPWKERYVKHARIEIAGAAGQPGSAAMPAPTGMDVLMLSGLQPARPGDTLTFQVLRDGAPLPDFAVELRGEAPAQARWLRTDHDGRVAAVAPAPGAWVLRGTDLRLSTTDPALWESRFVTLGFRVAAPR